MASSFEDKIKKLAAFDRILAMQYIFNDKQVQELIHELNIKQLQQGKDSKDRSLPFYSKTSVRKFGKKAGRITLFETGAFYASIHTIVNNSGVVIDADAQKENTNLFNRYGVDIIGLDDVNMSVLADFAKSKLIEYINGLVR